jgi:hypothetical protein
METMACPHCCGRGTVGIDYLTDDLVDDVFRQYCDIFGYHVCYGVEKWDDNGDTVTVRQDTSAMSCYNYDDHTFPREWFTRDVELREQLMIAKRDEKKIAAEAEARQKKQNRLIDIEREAARLKKELEQ